jgi:chorismate mutase
LERCEALGIQLITLQEHLWASSPEKVKARLRSILGVTTSIAGRKTKIVELSVEDATSFLKSNHLQGSAKSTVQLGLEHDGEIVMVATFGKPRWSKTHSWELIRMAAKQGVTVQGGASKLMKHFRASYDGSMLSYADRCWSTGNVYKKLGFAFSHNAAPSYWWVHHKLGIYSRYQTQKKKLERLLTDLGKDFYPELSEEDNMKLAGFIALFDRGNSVWVLD